MNDKPESSWWQAIKRTLSDWWQQQGPVVVDEGPAEDAKTQRLYRTPNNEPTFRCIMDHAVVSLGNEMAAAMEAPPGPVRDGHIERAAAMRAFLSEIEARREIWRETIKQRLAGKQ